MNSLNFIKKIFCLSKYSLIYYVILRNKQVNLSIEKGLALRGPILISL